jgi:alanyl-tRNA synthetase
MQSRAPSEPEVREFDAEVRRIDPPSGTGDERADGGRSVAPDAGEDGPAVVLEETYFYAASGGQPADRGTIAGVPVVDVRDDGDDVVHELAESVDVEAGETVHCAVDDEFRTYCMRAHTASHVLYGAARRLCEELGYGGFDISSEKVRVDLATPTDVDDDLLVDLERLTNRAVWESRSVTWEEVPVADARSREEVAFNTKTEEGVMAGAETVRLVDVDGWDVAACGGTHVRNTREIGPVTVLDRSNPGEGLTRVEFAVGPDGIDRRATVHRAALVAARTLDTSVDELPDVAARLVTERDDLRERLETLQADLVAATVSEFDTVDRDGTQWRVGVVDVDGAGPNDVADPVREAVGGDDGPDAVVAVGRDGRTYVVAGTNGEVDAGSIVEQVTAEFGGGGGGGSRFAQGGGIDAAPDAVVTFLADVSEEGHVDQDGEGDGN